MKSNLNDSRPSIVLPPDARAALAKDAAAKAAWERLSYTHRKEHAEAITGFSLFAASSRSTRK